MTSISTAPARTTRPVRYIPEPPPRSPAVVPAAATDSKSWPDPFNVLLVEDNDDEITIVQRTLKRAGLTDSPHVARDGRTALQTLMGQSPGALEPSPLTGVPDVVLLDIGLPDVSGLIVLRRIKDHDYLADVPVVMLSGADNDRLARVCMDLGANMYIVKPFSYVQAMNVIVAVQKHWLAAENFRRMAAQWSELRAA